MQSKERWFNVHKLQMKAVLYVFIPVGFCGSPCFSQTFTDQTAALTAGLTGWRMAWGDYNDDGYVDFLTGNNVYRNNGPNEDGNWSFTPVFGLVAGGLGKIHMCRVYDQQQWGNINAVPNGAAPAYLDWNMWNGLAPKASYNLNY